MTCQFLILRRGSKRPRTGYIVYTCLKDGRYKNILSPSVCDTLSVMADSFEGYVLFLLPMATGRLHQSPRVIARNCELFSGYFLRGKQRKCVVGEYTFKCFRKLKRYESQTIANITKCKHLSVSIYSKRKTVILCVNNNCFLDKYFLQRKRKKTDKTAFLYRKQRQL